MAELTAALVAIDTENPPGRNYERCLRFLGERVEALGFDADIERIDNDDADRDHPRYWLRFALGDSGPTVYFHGHIDVVPAQSRDQFNPNVTDETIFGRGSTDMKGGLVSMIYAMWAQREASVPLGGRIALRVVPDEETGGAFGSRALSDQGLLGYSRNPLLRRARHSRVCLWSWAPLSGAWARGVRQTPRPRGSGCRLCPHGGPTAPTVKGDRLTRRFFRRDPVTLARALLGQVLVRRLPDGQELAGRIVEVEAYLGAADRASHTYGGRRTKRNASMWLDGGHAYVYFVYGMHWCFNVVSDRDEVGTACLVRALEPVIGLAEMRRRQTRPAG